MLVGIDLRGRRVLVAGAGTVAGRRVRRLLDEGAEVVVVAPVLGDGALVELVSAEAVVWHQRRVEHPDVWGSWLVLAATDDPAVNDEVSRWAHAAGVWCINASDVEAGSARMAAISRHDGLLVGVVSQAGADPARVMAVRDALAAHIDSGTVDLRRRRSRRR
ncbi:MAG: NAD(P)-dependent oxidoreductase [Ornithinimicrobium sp.]